MRALTLLLSLLLVLPSTHASAPLTLETVLAKHAQAIGPSQGVQTRRVRLRLIGMAPFELPVVTEAVRPNLLRKEVSIQGSTQVTAFDGEDAWKTDPFVPGGEKPAALPAQEARMLVAEADFDGILVNHAAKRVKLVYAGPATVDGKAAHKLGATLADGTTATIWLDANTFLEVKRTQPSLVMGKMQPIDIVSSDYRLVDGLRIAHKIDIGLAGAKDKMSIVLDAVELNPKIDLARFSRPRAN